MPPPHSLVIVSGGQTGVDRAALDAALSLGLPVEGWVPAGRAAEDGRIPDRYPWLQETKRGDPADRTRRNVARATALLVLRRGPAVGGTALALREARTRRRPVLDVDLAGGGEEAAARQVSAWLHRLPPPLRVNVAGPRESEAPGIHAAARRVLATALRAMADTLPEATPDDPTQAPEHRRPNACPAS